MLDLCPWLSSIAKCNLCIGDKRGEGGALGRERCLEIVHGICMVSKTVHNWSTGP